MDRGYVKLWRKSLDAGWIRDHKLWAFWTWCLLKATHTEFDAIVGRQRIRLMPGQFIFGRRKAAEETGLTEQEIRTIIAFLKKVGNLTIKSTNKFSIISIVNWPIYQAEDLSINPLTNQQLTSKQPHTRTEEHKNIKRTPGEIFSEISVLLQRYPDQGTITEVFQAISSTRKANRIADSVKLSILRSWEKYPVVQVMAGIRTYLDKGYADQEKDEKYLLGIIRNTDGQDTDNRNTGRAMKSTGSALLDAYYRGKLSVNQDGTARP